MKKLFELSDITFKEEVLGYHSGQLDIKLSAVKNNQELGYINYSEYLKKPHINYIEVYHQKQGIGQRLVKQLQMKYPNEEIEWGMTTSEGEALRKSLPTITLKNKKYEEYKIKLDKLQKLEEQYTDLFENHNLSSEERQRISIKWNKVHDLKYVLEERLHEMEPSKTLIKI